MKKEGLEIETLTGSLKFHKIVSLGFSVLLVFVLAMLFFCEPLTEFRKERYEDRQEKLKNEDMQTSLRKEKDQALWNRCLEVFNYEECRDLTLIVARHCHDGVRTEISDCVKYELEK